MGTGATTWRVTLSEIAYGPEEEQAVLQVLRSRWLTQGPRTAELELRFAERVGARHAVAVSNCTAALHLSLLAAGVGPGDEVIVPALTFVATANAALYCGARPVFADVVGPECLLMDPDDVDRKVTAATRAIVPMHYAGYPCDMDALGEIARRRRLRIVEDAAHAPGSTWRGRPIGSVGDASCFSFFGNKNLVTGEGGMVTTDDDEIARFVRSRRSHGMTALSYDKHRGHASGYDVVGVGHNYRLTEIQAALGLAQLGKLDRNNAARRACVRRYRERLRNVPGLTIPFEGRETESSCHIFPVVLPPRADRDRLQRALKDQGIQTSVHYPPVHWFSSFRGRYDARVPRVEELAERLLTLPLHPLLSEDDVDAVCEALTRALGESPP